MTSRNPVRISFQRDCIQSEWDIHSDILRTLLVIENAGKSCQETTLPLESSYMNERFK